MTRQTISSFLKQLRKTSGFSANEVVNKLQKYDIDISAKTLYGYESGLSMLNADTFVALCRIYKCDNPMDMFGTPSISSKEYNLVEKYRTLDIHGKDMVNTVLNKEAERMTELKKEPSTVIDNGQTAAISNLQSDIALDPRDADALSAAVREAEESYIKSRSGVARKKGLSASSSTDGEDGKAVNR